MRAQSAMEYLMTYGWAILIIAIVLAALFQLGVFSSNTFAPKASPGSCQVFRPNGPGSTQFISTEGVCNGELPQYVAQFNGQSSYVRITNSPSLLSVNASNAFTVAVWSKTSSLSKLFDGAYCDEIRITGGSVEDYGTHNDQAYSYIQNPSQWTFVVVTKNTSGYGNLYSNGQSVGSASGLPAVSVYPGYFFTVGAEYACGSFQNYMSGMMSNLQVYNASLSQSEITALYQEGIGGAPIDLQHLVGWWPLNGNAHDYSGNNNNGQTNGGVVFTANWENGYTQS